MARWTGIVVALPPSRPDGMASRLPTYLHPIAGRPLVWHSAAAFCEVEDPPARLLIISEGDLSPELFEELPVPVDLIAVPPGEERLRRDTQALAEDEDVCVVAHAAAVVPPAVLARLRDGSPGQWVSGGGSSAAALRSDPEHLTRFFRLSDPFEIPNGALAASDDVAGDAPVPIVRDRAQFGLTVDRVRRALIHNLMNAGVTFLLPDSVLVDVDVRIGRDSIIYPGAVLEGTTTIGEETVIGPGCRIIDSWVGSGVEMRGWNYISHTSIRNRAILEPYVRRGFD